ncbi:MAG: hypothetical protein WD972_00550 [Candidatus Andersenbacteria bacterium]
MPFFTTPTSTSFDFFPQIADIVLTWGWLFILFFILWIAWEIYQFIKHVDFISSIPYTYFQITVPVDAAETPKAMEQAFEVWGGIHKDPDIIERFFEGYFLPWYSCELHCTRGRVRFIMVVPTSQRKFFEGVIYGQYPTAELKEIDDYSQRYSYRDIEKTFDMYGSEVVLAEEDYYPIRTYREYEDMLAEDDKFIDPLQALIEAFTTIEEGEEFWVQVLVKPVSAKVINKWADKGQARMLEISGRAKEPKPGLIARFRGTILSLPTDLVSLIMTGELPEAKEDEKKGPQFLDPAQSEEIEGILHKISRSGFRTKIRVIHISPAGKLHKPNISKAIGVFKQFNSFFLNSFKPDPLTKSNGPNYFFKQSRRHYRKRFNLLNFQFRDFWGDDSGYMMNAEELATLYHFPNKYGRSPSIERATSGLGSAPENLPYT